MKRIAPLSFLNKKRATRWAFYYLLAFFFVAIAGDFLANEKPLYCKLEGKRYFPVIRQYAIDLGWGHWEARFLQEGWKDQPYEQVVFPLVPYSAKTIDRSNLGAKSPQGPQRVKSKWGWHWLGTDMAGHDVAAGLIHGSRVAFLVGLIGMLVATLLGIFFGGLAGFFGDTRFRLPVGNAIAYTLAIALSGYLFWAFFLAHGGKPGMWGQLWIPFGGSALFLFAGWVFAQGLNRLPPGRKTMALRFDFWITRLTEVLNSLPTLLFVMAILAILRRPSIYAIMIVIGLVRWTGISRLVRAELLRVRSLDYIEAARVLGYSPWRIFFRHALPNSLGPVWVTLAFGMAGAILVEASLSFLGVGLPVETVTWGSLMRQISGSNIRPWWLAVFPGTAIFLTVASFNLMGEALSEWFDPRGEARR